MWRSKPTVASPPEPAGDAESDDSDNAPPVPRSTRGGPRYEETPQPSTTDPKHPSLRRGAILFLALVFRSVHQQQASAAPADRLSRFGDMRMPGVAATRSSAVDVKLVGRAQTVLRYVSETDEDGLVRYQAKEALSEIEL